MQKIFKVSKVRKDVSYRSIEIEDLLDESDDEAEDEKDGPSDS